MSTKFRGGPEAGQISPQPVKKAALWIVLGGLILLFLIGSAVYATYCRTTGKPLFSSDYTAHSGSRVSADIQSQPTSGIVEVNDKDWKGFKCDDPNMHLVWNMLTDDVWYWVRFNRDPNRVYKCYPANWKPGSSLDIKDPLYLNVVEILIGPGQDKTTGAVSWSARPRNG